MDDSSMEETEQEEVNGTPSLPRKKAKTDVGGPETTNSAMTSSGTFLPNHIRYKIDAYEESCSCVLFLHNSLSLISGGKGNAVKFWDANTGLLARSLEGFRGSVCDMAIKSDNSLLVAGLTSHEMCVWDLNSFQVFRTLRGTTQKVIALDISKQTGRFTVATAANDRFVTLWDLHTDSDYSMRALQYHNGFCIAVCFYKDDISFCSGYANGNITFSSIDRIWINQDGGIKAHTQSVTSISAIQNGNVLLTSGRDNWHNLIDVRAMEVCRKFKTRGNQLATNSVRTCVSPDENFVGLGSVDGSIGVWSIQMGKIVKTLKGHNSPVLSVAWSGIGSSLASAHADGKICIWS